MRALENKLLERKEREVGVLAQSNCGLVSNKLQQNFFQRRLIVEWLFNNILKIRQNRLGET